MKRVLKLTSIALLVSLAAGCSSSGGTSGGGETTPPKFDGDLGYENVDPNFGNDAPEVDEGPDLGFDLGYVYIPDIDKEVPVPTHPIERHIQNPDAKMGVVKERSDDQETLYSIYWGERRVGEIIINEEGITVTALHSDKEISAKKNTDEDSWQVRGVDGNVKGDVKRLDNGNWIVREEITREVYVSVVRDGQRIFVPVGDIKDAIKPKAKKAAPKMIIPALQTQRVRPTLG
ncbi:hypothetical protein [Vibrio astriarenae]|uniref:hypothetical protein n=1 Tax=Vibrio astriarenae TaxID=1481923 RepID=UPI00373581AA